MRVTGSCASTEVHSRDYRDSSGHQPGSTAARKHRGSGDRHGQCARQFPTRKATEELAGQPTIVRLDPGVPAGRAGADADAAVSLRTGSFLAGSAGVNPLRSPRLASTRAALRARRDWALDLRYLPHHLAEIRPRAPSRRDSGRLRLFNIDVHIGPIGDFRAITAPWESTSPTGPYRVMPM
jgi:hypothetical protein